MLVLAVILLPAITQNVQAQTLYGAIVGNVSDQTGATIPGVDVTVTHADSGRVRTAITTDCQRISIRANPCHSWQQFSFLLFQFTEFLIPCSTPRIPS